MSANIQKNIPKAEEKIDNVPIQLLQEKKNYEKAGYIYDYGENQKKYIEYNTLRNKRVAEDPKNEIVDIIKIYRLQDRDTLTEHLVWWQLSKVYDYNRNLVKCPVEEIYGLVNSPQTNKITNSNLEVIDIEETEMQIMFNMPYNNELLLKLFNKTRIAQNIVCYIGYTRPFKEKTNDFIDMKRLIRNQNKFIFQEFNELISVDEKSNIKETFNYLKYNKRSMVEIENKEQKRKENDIALAGDFNDVEANNQKQEQNTKEAELVTKTEEKKLKESSGKVEDDQNPFQKNGNVKTSSSEETKTVEKKNLKI